MGEKTGFTFRPIELYIDGQKIESIEEVTILDSEHTDETIEPIKNMKFDPGETYSFTFTMSRWKLLKCKLAMFVSRIFHSRVVVTGSADVRRIERQQKEEIDFMFENLFDDNKRITKEQAVVLLKTIRDGFFNGGNELGEELDSKLKSVPEPGQKMPSEIINGVTIKMKTALDMAIEALET